MIETGGHTVVEERAQMRWAGARQQPDAGTLPNPAALERVWSETVAAALAGEPICLGDNRGLLRSEGIAVLQVPQGVTWDAGQPAHRIIGIAGTSDRHVTILLRLTRLLEDEARLPALAAQAMEAETPAGVRALDDGGS